LSTRHESSRKEVPIPSESIMTVYESMPEKSCKQALHVTVARSKGQCEQNGCRMRRDDCMFCSGYFRSSL
jgi:hypothetical protein